MKKSNSNQVFPKYEYIVYCIVLIFGQTYFTYSSYDGFWLSLFNNMSTLFSGLLFLLWWNDYYSITRIMWAILPVLPIFIAGARNFSPPYSTFILFYFISNIMGYIFFMVLEMYGEFDYGIGGEVIFYAILISILILHLNIILSKNPIVKGIDNLAIKLPSSSGSSSLGDDLD